MLYNYKETVYSATCSTDYEILLLCDKATREQYSISGFRDPLMLTKGKLYYNIIQHSYSLRRTKITIIELCCTSRSMDEIVDRVLCYKSMPKGDSRGRPYHARKKHFANLALILMEQLINFMETQTLRKMLRLGGT